MKLHLLSLTGLIVAAIAVGAYFTDPNGETLALIPAGEPFSSERNAELILANEPNTVRAKGVIIGYLTYARYVVLGVDETATLRGWVVEGPESIGTQPPESKDAYPEFRLYSHQFSIGQRIAFSGELWKSLSWCGDLAEEYVSKAGVQTTPISEEQCLGWVQAGTVEIAPAE